MTQREYHRWKHFVNIGSKEYVVFTANILIFTVIV